MGLRELTDGRIWLHAVSHGQKFVLATLVIRLKIAEETDNWDK